MTTKTLHTSSIYNFDALGSLVAEAVSIIRKKRIIEEPLLKRILGVDNVTFREIMLTLIDRGEVYIIHGNPIRILYVGGNEDE